jgi:HK97 family phage major capsid protein
MQVDESVAKQLAELLVEKFGITTNAQLDRAVADIIRRTDERQARGNTFSFAQAVRGMSAVAGHSLNDRTREADIAYARALSTGSTPGSYLIPTMQADEVIAFLSLGGVARSAGVKVIPMSGIQKLNIPTALTAPTWVWMAQNSIQTATDPNLGQVSFDLKTRRALIAVPNELLASSVPAFDTLLAQLIALAAAEHEDTALFATSTVSGGPQAIMSAAGITTLNAGGGSANGGNLTYADILSVLAKAANVKAKPPFCWFASGRTFYQRIMGLLDLQSRPIFIPSTDGLYKGPNVGTVAPVGMLMGFPVFVTPAILENEAVGSGTNQSHLIFTNPGYILLAQDQALEIAISSEFLFSANQTCIRAVSREDAAVAPAAGLIALVGIN